MAIKAVSEAFSFPASSGEGTLQGRFYLPYNEDGSEGTLDRINPVRTPWDWLTRDSAIVDAYIADPLCGHPFTSAGYLDLLAWLRQVSRFEWIERLPAQLPVLLLSGTEDPIGQYGAGPRQIYHKLKAVGHPVELILHPDGRHEMLNEINRQAVWQDIAAWIDQVSRSTPAHNTGAGNLRRGGESPA